MEKRPHKESDSGVHSYFIGYGVFPFCAITVVYNPGYGCDRGISCPLINEKTYPVALRLGYGSSEAIIICDNAGIVSYQTEFD